MSIPGGALQIRKLVADDVRRIWVLNESATPGVGRITEEGVERLLGYSALALGAFDGDTLLGFVLCLSPQTDYSSLNYRWFCERYSDFLYVDRIAVATDFRSQRIGALLYEQVFAYAEERSLTVMAEINLDPPNPGSVRFHERHGFVRVGRLQHPSYLVAMYCRAKAESAGD